MKKNTLVAPSILSADFSRLREEIKKAEDAKADMIHVDVMDGCFVPNITIGPLIVEAVRRCTDLPLDVHLMIEAPHRFIKDFVEAGSDIITIHAEAYGEKVRSQKSEVRKGSSATTHKINAGRVIEVLGQIKSLGIKAGISLNPDSSFCINGVLDKVQMILIMSVHPGFGGQKFIPEILPKIREARKAYKGDIEVDGGINDKNVKSVVEAGANIIVTGSYFFSAKDTKAAIQKLKEVKA
ncbi:MAG: ribulose-phosphate 3-epimerase [Candidatus Omnitrophota bacterium]